MLNEPQQLLFPKKGDIILTIFLFPNFTYHSLFPFTKFDLLMYSKSASVECGMATGCVKILKKSLDFDFYGKYIPEHKRGPNQDLFRCRDFTIKKILQMVS